MSVSRRQFCEWLAAASGLVTPASPYAGAETGIYPAGAWNPHAVAEEGPHIGNLYPLAQQLADRSPLELSFLRSEFKNLGQWQRNARMKVFEHLFYAPPTVAPEAQVIRRTEKSDYIEEYLTFRTTPDLRVPACVLVPRNAKLPAPAIVVLHDHGGFYLWGKEKMVEGEAEHPALTKFKQDLYEGKSIAAELARQGYVVIVIDMFYWGERRMILDDDPPAYRERPLNMTDEE